MSEFVRRSYRDVKSWYGVTTMYLDPQTVSGRARFLGSGFGFPVAVFGSGAAVRCGADRERGGRA